MKVKCCLRAWPVLFSLFLASPAHAGSATWGANPGSDWNTAANWTPATVPNGPTDVATLGATNTPTINLSANVTLDQLTFPAGASAYSIDTAAAFVSLATAAVTNASGTVQTITVATRGTFSLTDNGRLDILVRGVSEGSTFEGENGGLIWFHSTASAGEATLIGQAGLINLARGGEIEFDESSHAENAFIDLEGGQVAGSIGATVLFLITSRAENATINVGGGGASGAQGATALFNFNAMADNAVITLDGGTVAGAGGGIATFYANSNAVNCTLIANSGVNGGSGGTISFRDYSLGGTARIELLGNSQLDISSHNVNRPNIQVGSVEGSGSIFLGAHNLSVGLNQLSTEFAGVIADGGGGGGTGGSLTKVGSGILTLTGPSIYAGPTVVNSGTLTVSNTTGSATGNGPLTVTDGTLSGSGTVAGVATIGDAKGAAAVLSPGAAGKLGRLTFQSLLTFKSDATYSSKLNSKKAKANSVTANGVNIGAGAQFSFPVVGNKKLVAGTAFTVISNTAATPISGAFVNLADGSAFTAGSNSFQVNYHGGDGNDLTLTVLP